MLYNHLKYIENAYMMKYIENINKFFLKMLYNHLKYIENAINKTIKTLIHQSPNNFVTQYWQQIIYIYISLKQIK